MEGTYEHSIDTKSRLIIPARLRDELGSSFYLSLGTDVCLFIYPCATWDRIKARLSEQSIADTESARFLFANTAKCELDSQGRIVIPQFLKEYAELDRDVVVVGVNDRAEIWATDNWKPRAKEALTKENVRATIRSLGI